MAILAKQLTADGKLPNRAHPDDAGADLFAMERKVLYGLSWCLCNDEIGHLPDCSHTFNIQIAVQIPPGYVGIIADKSGLAKKKLVKVLGGVVDVGYTGEIGITLMNFGMENWLVEPGMKIAQLVIVPAILREQFEWADDLGISERGTKGFGSSGLR